MTEQRQLSPDKQQPLFNSQTWSHSQTLFTTVFCFFAVLRPLVEMTTIHYKPFENSRHKCHPLSAVSTPHTQGIFRKTQPSAFRNSIKFLSLCSRLFFSAIPLLCIGAEINHWACSWRISIISD